MPKPLVFKRLSFLLACAVLPTLMIGFLIAVSNFRSLMLREKPAALTAPLPAPAAFSPRHRMKAAILVGNEGTEITDLLGPYAVLAESGAFDVYTVAPRREASPLGSTLAIVPDFGFENAPQADLLVLPPNFDGESPQTLSWIQAQGAKARLVLAVCDGARLAARAGLLNGARATSHFLSLGELRQSAPGVNWVSSGPRVIVDDSKSHPERVTTAGVTASLEGAREAVARLTGMNSEATHKAEKLIELDARQSVRKETSLHTGESLPFFARAAFDWARPIRAVWIGPGASEIQLAAMLDLLPRTLSVHLSTLGEAHAPVRTRRGLTLIPMDEAKMAGPAHTILLPQGTENAAMAREWAAKYGATVMDWSAVDEASSFSQAFSEIEAWDGPALARSIAHLVEWPAPLPAISESHSSPWRLFWPPLVLMTLGVLAGSWLRQRFFPAA